MPGVLYVPYVECPRVEKPPAKNMIATTMRMMSSKNCSFLLLGLFPDLEALSRSGD